MSDVLFNINFVITLSKHCGPEDYHDNVMKKFIINNRTHALNRHQFVFYEKKLSNFPLSLAEASHEFQIHMSVRILTIKINQ